MSDNEDRGSEPNSGYIGEGVVFKGSISAPDMIVVDGTVEGDISARTVKIGVSGIVKGSLVAVDADIQGRLSDKVEVKQFLLVRATGRIEGEVACGDVQIEKGAVLAASVTSIHAESDEQAATDGQAVADAPPAPSIVSTLATRPAKPETPASGVTRMKLTAAE